MVPDNVSWLGAEYSLATFVLTRPCLLESSLIAVLQREFVMPVTTKKSTPTSRFNGDMDSKISLQYSTYFVKLVVNPK